MFGAHQILFKGYYMKRLIVALALLAPAIAIAQTRQGSLTCTTPTITTATATITPQPTKTPIWARNAGGNQIGGHKITHHGSIWE